MQLSLSRSLSQLCGLVFQKGDLMEKNTCMILALDVIDREKALRIAEDVQVFVDAIKVGYPLILATGLEIIRELARFTPVIADIKVADIPNTNRLICEQVFKAGADAIIVQGFTGRDSLDACIEVASEYRKRCVCCK